MESLSGRAQHLSLRSGQSRGRRHAWNEARMPRSRHVSTRDTPGTGEGLSRQSKAPGRPYELCALKRSDVQQRPSQKQQCSTVCISYCVRNTTTYHCICHQIIDSLPTIALVNCPYLQNL